MKRMQEVFRYNYSRAENGEERRIAGVIFFSAAVSIIGSIVLLLLSLGSRHPIPVFPFIISTISLGISVLLLRKGKTSPAGLCLLYAMQAFIFYLSSINKGIQDAAMFAIPGVLVIAALILPRWSFVLYTTITIAGIGIVGFAQAAGKLQSPYASPISLFDVGDVMIIIAFTGVTIRFLSNEREVAAEKIKALLRERENLLKEVHHRIKNNMNVMMSLLSLQADAIKDPNATIVLRDAGNRIRSMMVLYENLYRSEDYGQISAKIYLTHLLDLIVDTFPNSGRIAIENHIDDFMLDANKISPLGIIVNELITNSIKYAFPGERQGLITVAASLRGEKVTVRVEDNGIGIPEFLDIESAPGFGLQLVTMLTKQLDGTMQLVRENGTKFVLDFAMKAEEF
ncbi:MAG: ATP-binding protein [Ignavibacteriales bacterium]|nr:ATP-binding protein [Ignavibacteriales bacterium]